MPALHLPDPPVDQPDIKDVSTAKIKQILPDIDVLLFTTTDVERRALFQALRPLPGETALLEGAAGQVTVRLGHFGRYYAAHVECAMGSVGRAASTLTMANATYPTQPETR